MKPVGPLMWEHRLIEEMLASLLAHVGKIEKTKKVNPVIIDVAVDFVRMYADRTHHGKEEEILFRDLAKKNLTPELKKIKERHKDNQQEQARLTMELYKKEGVNPFSGCLTLLIQLPIIFALYYVFLSGIKFDPKLLYSFISLPQTIGTFFLGINLAQKSMILAFLAGVTQYFQLKLSMPAPTKREEGVTLSFQEELTRNMNVQMKYIFPFLVFFIAYSFSSAIALYWLVSNLFAIGQELYVKKLMKK